MQPQLHNNLDINLKTNQDFKISIVSIVRSTKIEERTNKKVVPK